MARHFRFNDLFSQDFLRRPAGPGERLRNSIMLCYNNNIMPFGSASSASTPAVEPVAQVPAGPVSLRNPGRSAVPHSLLYCSVPLALAFAGLAVASGIWGIVLLGLALLAALDRFRAHFFHTVALVAFWGAISGKSYSNINPF